MWSRLVKFRNSLFNSVLSLYLFKKQPSNMPPVSRASQNRRWLGIDHPLSTTTTTIASAKNEGGNKTSPYKSINIMSYNILAQPLIKRDMFPYANKTCLRWKSRKQSFMNEITYHKPDIACLQEVGSKNYHQDFHTFFKSQGYDTHFYQSRSKSHGKSIYIYTHVNKCTIILHLCTISASISCTIYHQFFLI